MTKNEHVVLLIGSKYKGSIALTRRDYPHIDARAKHGHMVCLHCGQHFPLQDLLPLSIGMVTSIQKQFLKEHKNCVKGRISSCTISGGMPPEEEIEECLAVKETEGAQ